LHKSDSTAVLSATPRRAISSRSESLGGLPRLGVNFMGGDFLCCVMPVRLMRSGAVLAGFITLSQAAAIENGTQKRQGTALSVRPCARMGDMNTPSRNTEASLARDGHVFCAGTLAQCLNRWTRLSETEKTTAFLKMGRDGVEPVIIQSEGIAELARDPNLLSARG
jgi:hypothetical protein